MFGFLALQFFLPLQHPAHGPINLVSKPVSVGNPYRIGTSPGKGYFSLFSSFFGPHSIFIFVKNKDTYGVEGLELRQNCGIAAFELLSPQESGLNAVGFSQKAKWIKGVNCQKNSHVVLIFFGNISVLLFPYVPPSIPQKEEHFNFL